MTTVTASAWFVISTGTRGKTGGVLTDRWTEMVRLAVKRRRILVLYFS